MQINGGRNNTPLIKKSELLWVTLSYFQWHGTIAFELEQIETGDSSARFSFRYNPKFKFCCQIHTAKSNITVYKFPGYVSSRSHSGNLITCINKYYASLEVFVYTIRNFTTIWLPICVQICHLKMISPFGCTKTISFSHIELLRKSAKFKFLWISNT